MKYLNIICSFYCFWLINNPIQAQSSALKDSLLRILKTNQDDTLTVEALNELAWIYRNNDYPKSYQYATQAQNLATKINYPLGLATAYNRQGLIHQNKREYDIALGKYQQAFKIEKQNKHQYGIARSQNLLGIIFLLKKKHKKAIPYFERSILTLEKIGQKSSIAIKKINLAICYEKLGDIKHSIQHYLKALEIYKNSQNQNQIGKCYLGLGILYRKSNRLRDAKKNLTTAIDIFSKKDNKTFLANAYQELGLFYHRTQSYDQALIQYQKSLDLKRELNIQSDLPMILNNIGFVYLKQFQLEKAKLEFLKSQKLAIEQKDTLVFALVNNNLGLIYKQEKNYSKAIEHFKKSLVFAHQVSDKYTRRNVLENLSFVYARVEQYDLSYKYFNRYKWARDSLENNFRQAMEYKEEYENERQTNALLAKEKETQEAKLARQQLLNYALGIGLGLVVLAGLAVLKSWQDRRKALASKQQIDRLLVEHELVALGKMLEGQESERNRIAQDLHDRLGSLLSMVKLHVDALPQTPQMSVIEETSQYQQASKLLDDACQEVRDVAHDIASSVLRKYGLIPALNELKLSLEDAGKMSVNLVVVGFEERRLPSHYETQVYRITRELVGNVLNHAEASRLELQLYWKNGNLHLSVEDNGRGFNPEKLNDKNGLGMKGVIGRIKALSGTYEIDSSEGNGTRVLMDLSIEKLEL